MTTFAEDDDRLIYNIPLTNSGMAYLRLPDNLSKEDADKVCRVVRALAYEDTPPWSGKVNLSD